MRWLLVLALAALVAVGTEARASSRSTEAASPGLAQLSRQVAALKKQVTSLKRQVNGISSETDVNYSGDGCIVGATADLFIATWAAVDTFAQQNAGKTIFGRQLPFNDKKACENLYDPHIPRQVSVPPSLSTYNALINWINP